MFKLNATTLKKVLATAAIVAGLGFGLGISDNTAEAAPHGFHGRHPGHSIHRPVHRPRPHIRERQHDHRPNYHHDRHHHR